MNGSVIVHSWGVLDDPNRPGIVVSKHPTLAMYYVEMSNSIGRSGQFVTSYGAARRIYKKFLKEHGGRSDL